MAGTLPDLDRELADLPPDLRWRTWMDRIEAVIFASAAPVPRESLLRVVGQGASVDLLIDDIQGQLQGRPYELTAVAGGWMFRTRSAFADSIHAAMNPGDRTLDLTEFEIAVLAAIAFHQPLTREGLREIFGKEISRALIARLRDRELIGSGPRSPRPGAPHTFVTTPAFLVAFDLQTLRDLPDLAQLQDAGMLVREVPRGGSTGGLPDRDALWTGSVRGLPNRTGPR